MTAHDTAAVDVCRVRVSAERDAWAMHWERLDDAERERAQALLREADRARFVIARSTLREQLGRRLQCEPRYIRFARNAYGKPVLARPHAWHFNTSHAGDWVLHAFSAHAPVGIDVEALPAQPLRLDDVEQALSNDEREHLAALPADARGRALIALWSCKEAYVKAWGQGLSRSLREIGLRALPDGGFALAHDYNEQGPLFDWSLMRLPVDDAHLGFLACPRAAVTLTLLDIDDPA